MIRWGLVVGGFFVICVTFYSWMSLVFLDNDPLVVNLAKARQLVNENQTKYVTIAASADVAVPIFPTGLATPPYAARPYNDPRPLGVEQITPHLRVSPLLGCAVTASLPLDTQTLEIEEVERYNDPRTNHPTQFAKFKRLLAMVQDSNGTAFVLSPRWPQDVRPPVNKWLNQKTIHGRLVLLDDVPKNIPNLAGSWGQIRSRMLQRNLAVPRHAVVVMPDPLDPALPPDLAGLTAPNAPPPDPKNTPPAPTPPPHPPNVRYLPITGSDNTLFVEIAAGQEAQVRQSITGLLTPYKHTLFKGFSNVIGKPLPNRVGILKVQSANSLSHAMGPATWLRLGLGAACLVGGLLWVRHARKAAEKIAAENQTCQTIISSEKLRPLAPKTESEQIIALFRCLRG